MHKLTSATTSACDASFQVLRPGKHACKERSVPWWNEELTTLRKKALAMRVISKDYKRRRPEAGKKAVVPRKQQDISNQTVGG